ncbi:MAG: SIMPL domain-containing protein [Chitinophagaceae bacterium]|nr:MAG: SIMPL domain-containing protein [Chitinophagaceae bacterium]
MKKLFIPFCFSLISISSAGQIAGNAVISSAGNNIYDNPNYGPAPVDLSINSYSSNFSQLLEANVMINVKATSFVATFSLSQFSKTVAEAESDMKARTDLFKNMLQQTNSGAQYVFVDPVSMVPTYEMELTEKKLSKTYNEVPSGFEIKKNVQITFKDQSQINDIISIAAKAEVYDLVKVDYNVDDKDALLALLRNEALRILMEKKKVMEQAGIFSRFTNVGEKQGSAFPSERYAQYTAYKTSTAPYQLASYKKGQPAQTVQYNYADKQKTFYYDKVTDKQFDKVINPVVYEPMVQVYFSLKGQFVIYDPEKELADKKYNEKLKDLQLKEMELNLDLKRKQLDLPPLKRVVETSVKKVTENAAR